MVRRNGQPADFERTPASSGPNPNPPILAMGATSVARPRRSGGARSTRVAVAVPVKTPAERPERIRPTSSKGRPSVVKKHTALSADRPSPGSSSRLRLSSSDRRRKKSSAAITPAAYVRDDLGPAVSFRGGTHVHGPTELALWLRKRDGGLVKAIAERPRALVYYGGPDVPGPRFLSIEGRARVAPEINDEVWAAIIDGERRQDPERKGVAGPDRVDTVAGARADGFVQQVRD
jgi:hypothetical protein